MSGGVRYRLGIATSGFRGGASSGGFISGTVELSDISTVTDVFIDSNEIDIDFGAVAVDIFSESFDITVSSNEIEIQDEVQTVEVTVEDC